MLVLLIPSSAMFEGLERMWGFNRVLKTLGGERGSVFWLVGLW